MENDNEIDLFDNYESLPQDVKDVLYKHSNCAGSYEKCNKLIQDLEAIGYTCDYGLDCVPYELKKINLDKSK